LLARLRVLKATIDDAVVDSRYTQQMRIPAADRRLIDGPVHLRDVENLALLRGELTARQTHIGQAPGARGGHSTKRIRLQLNVPGFGAGDAESLERQLAEPFPATIGEVVDAIRALRLQSGPGGQEKRHQPLTLLWAIGRARQGQQRLVRWPMARTQIAQLIRDHGGPADRPNAELPFLALAGSGLWQLTAVPPRGLTGTARLQWLNNASPVVRGGLTEPVSRLFAASEDAAVQAAGLLLGEHFSCEEWDQVLSAVGLESLAARLHSPAAQPAATGTSSTYWWSAMQDERSWVEIRRVAEGLGQELRCPFVNAVGRRDGWWELVDDVRAGDCIYHWNADQGRFIGRSFAAAPRHVDAGTGDRIVRLRDFLPLVVDVGLQQVRGLAPQLGVVREAIAEQCPGATLYLPFQFRSDGLRLMSNYFAKLPQAMEQILFGSDGLAETGLPAPPAEDPDDPESEGNETRRGRPGGFLSPFKPRADTDYVSNVAGGPFRRGRKHETLVNDFARWLGDRGLKAASNAAIDLGLVQPPVIIEAKIVRGARWATAIREAVGQLYEYRYFQVVPPGSELLFLASAEIPHKWLDYLSRDRQIGAAWRTPDGFQMTARAAAALGIEP
jgi:hypothetical protein